MNSLEWTFEFLSLIILIVFFSLIKVDNRRLTRIEQKIDILLQEFEDDDEIISNFESVESYLIRGERLQAIQRLLELNPDRSLQEAIEVVATLEEQIKKQSSN